MMLSTLILQSLHVALLGLTFATPVHGSMDYVPNDIHCPKNSHAGFVHNTYTYIAPLHDFTNLVGSFFNISWYDGIVVTNTTGADNVPGASRSGPFNGVTYNETLTMFTERSDAVTFSFIGKGFSYTRSPKGPTVTLDGYTESMRFESICGGKATYIDVLTRVCSDNQIEAYDLWYTLHMTTFQGMAVNLGAPVLAGDCP
ncbi:hypothetical protein DFH08DRAFT_785680, partial [Mycena albidolilacea]